MLYFFVSVIVIKLFEMIIKLFEMIIKLFEMIIKLCEMIIKLHEKPCMTWVCQLLKWFPSCLNL